MPRDVEAWLAERGIAREPILSGGATSDDGATSDGESPEVIVGGDTTLSDDVAAAVAFLRNSTARTPQSVGRLRAKLTDRGTPASVIELALERAHEQGLVDDDAMAAALVEEGTAKGHAPRRVRADLLKRGFDPATIDRALASVEAGDLDAAAFAVAKEKADRLTGVDVTTAVRRVVGHLARRGYPDGLAIKVAREAVDLSRETARTAGH